MVIKKSKSFLSKKYVIVGSVIILLIVAASVAYFHSRQAQKSTAAGSSSIDYSPAPAAENNENDARKGSTSPSSTLSSGDSTATTPAASFSVVITGANVQPSNVHIGTQVSGTTSGTCNLTAEKAGQATLNLGSSSVRQNVNTFDCGVYNIATSAFSDSGVWHLVLAVSSNGSTNSGTYDVSIP